MAIMNEWIEEERVSRDIVFKIKTRTTIDEERGNLEMTQAACVDQGCVSILPIGNRHQRKRYRQR